MLVGNNTLMAKVIDEYTLEEITRAHEINAGVFIPFVIARLASNKRQREALLTVSLRDAENRETQRQLHLRWAAESIPEQPLAVPEKGHHRVSSLRRSLCCIGALYFVINCFDE